MCIKISKKTKSFNGITVLDNISLNLDKGIYKLSGANGSGKSTLIRIIGGFDKFDDGFKFPNRTNTLYLTVDPIGISPFSIRENIEILWYAFSINPDAKLISRVKEFFQINLDAPYGQASTGTKAKLGLSLLFAKQWDIILIDEVLSPLDTESVEYVAKELIKQSDKSTILYVFHNLNNKLLKENSHILKIVGGKIVEEK